MMAANREEAEAAREGGIFQKYWDAGFSVIPLNPRDKTPHFELLPTDEDGKAVWEEYSQRKPTQAEINIWAAAGANVGIVCGAISDNLLVLDVEHYAVPMVVWLTGPGEIVCRASWSTRTGTGGVHLYARTGLPIRGTVLKAPDGSKVADVRGEGQYVVAPPSMHPIGRRYAHHAGSFTNIARPKDALETFRQLIDKAYGTSVARSYSLPKAGMEILPPPVVEPEHLGRLEGMVRNSLSGKIARAIVRGARYGDGEWNGPGKNSDIMHAVLCEMVRRGWTDEQIHEIYLSFPIRTCCYADATRDHHGESLFWHSLKSAHAQVEREIEANKRTDAPGWKVEKVVRVNYEGDPEYWITIHRKDIDCDVLVKATVDDLASDRMFQKACIRSCGWAPQIPPTWAGKNWVEQFVNNLTTQATWEEVAVEATSGGYLRMLVIETLTHANIRPETPDRRGLVALGWSDDRWVYVYPKALFAKVEAKRRNLTPQQLWASIRSLGVERRLVNLGEERPIVWAFPKEMLNPF